MEWVGGSDNSSQSAAKEFGSPNCFLFQWKWLTIIHANDESWVVYTIFINATLAFSVKHCGLRSAWLWPKMGHRICTAGSSQVYLDVILLKPGSNFRDGHCVILQVGPLTNHSLPSFYDVQVNVKVVPQTLFTVPPDSTNNTIPPPLWHVRREVVRLSGNKAKELRCWSQMLCQLSSTMTGNSG